MSTRVLGHHSSKIWPSQAMTRVDSSQGLLGVLDSQLVVLERLGRKPTLGRQTASGRPPAMVRGRFWALRTANATSLNPLSVVPDPAGPRKAATVPGKLNITARDVERGLAVSTRSKLQCAWAVSSVWRSQYDKSSHSTQCLQSRQNKSQTDISRPGVP